MKEMSIHSPGSQCSIIFLDTVWI